MLGEELGHIITLEELQEAQPKITKRIVLVNSSKYTEEAFEYLLDLIDESEAIAFVINERKIYTHGEYFGGDLWEDTLNYFSKYTLLNEDNEITSQVYAQTSKDAIQFKGEGGITLYSDYDINRDASTIHVNYDLDAAVDNSSIVKINDGLSLVLEVNNDKIALKEYEAPSIKLHTPPMLEYDSGNTQVTINVDITRYEKIKLTDLRVTASGNSIAEPRLAERKINVMVFNNVKTNVFVDYQDLNRIQYSTSTTQDWGYRYLWGSGANAINLTNQDLFNKSLENTFREKTISLDIKDGQYGWVAYPSSTPLAFIDMENGMMGGWTKYSTFTMYGQGIEYQVYRTENVGLGKTTWKLTQKQ